MSAHETHVSRYVSRTSQLKCTPDSEPQRFVRGTIVAQLGRCSFCLLGDMLLRSFDAVLQDRSSKWHPSSKANPLVMAKAVSSTSFEFTCRNSNTHPSDLQVSGFRLHGWESIFWGTRKHGRKCLKPCQAKQCHGVAATAELCQRRLITPLAQVVILDRLPLFNYCDMQPEP